MKAAVCHAFGQPLQIEEVTLAKPGSTEVSVQLKACAICHSDIISLDGGWGGTLPAVFGHEAAGIVTEIGDKVSDIKIGDHVVVTLIRSCGDCHYCAQGSDVLCEGEFHLDQNSPLTSNDNKVITQGLRTGAFAEATVVEARQVSVIPKDIPFESASLLACGVLTGFGAVVNTAQVPAGSDVVVIGSGGVGINCIQGAVAAEAKTIIAVDLIDSKLKSAKEFGATHALNASDESLVENVQALTDGRGADYVFISVGVKSAIDSSIDFLAKGGTAVVVGMPPSGVLAQYDPGELASRNQSIIGSKMGSARVARDIPHLVSLYQQGQLKLDELVSEKFSLAQINQAIDSSKQGGALRNVIVF